MRPKAGVGCSRRQTRGCNWWPSPSVNRGGRRAPPVAGEGAQPKVGARARPEVSGSARARWEGEDQARARGQQIGAPSRLENTQGVIKHVCG